MFIEILHRTPSWVFVLLFALVVLGYGQTRDRSVRGSLLTLLPAAMIVLSLYGVLGAFGLNPLGLGAWALGVAIAIAIAAGSGRGSALLRRGVVYSAATRTFFVPGRWWPLALMMLIFLVRYAVAVAIARRPHVVESLAFAGLVSLAYGLLSGVFLARALAIRQVARPSGMPSSPGVTE